MANSLLTNPKVLDTSGSTSAITTPIPIRLIQWIDDTGDIADGDDMVFVLNGATITTKVQKPSDVGDHSVVMYEANFGSKPFKATFSLTTLDGGQVVIFTD